MDDTMRRCATRLTLLLALLLAGCGPSAPGAPVSEEAGRPVDPSGAQDPSADDAAAAPDAGDRLAYEGVSLVDPGLGLSLSGSIEPEQSGEGPAWSRSPEHRTLRLEGPPSVNTYHEPTLRVYPVADYLRLMPELEAMVEELERIIAQPPAEPDAIPLLPTFNAAQVLRARVETIAFEGGRGVRFLTQYDQAFVPINNGELFYAFQGLTEDGQWWVSAILPVAHPDLPADGTIDPAAYEDFATGFERYLAEARTLLEEQPAASFEPDLERLDALVGSIRID